MSTAVTVEQNGNAPRRSRAGFLSAPASTPGPPHDEVVRRAVIRCLAQRNSPMSPITLARETHLSTLVVVPLLGRLQDDALVDRHRDGTQSGHYGLTPRGRRHAQKRPTPS